jgi:predicted O-methyltransferase YrrM
VYSSANTAAPITPTNTPATKAKVSMVDSVVLGAVGLPREPLSGRRRWPRVPLNAQPFIEQIYPPLADELRTAMLAVAEHTVDAFSRLGRPIEQTTGVNDCALLYLLARHFGCRSALEAGTFIGASTKALSQAVSRNGGSVLTCDVVDWSTAVAGLPGVRFMHADCAAAVRRHAGAPFDLVFFDCVPNRETMQSVRAATRPDAILATHDYLPGFWPRRWSVRSKGRDTVGVVERWYGRPGRWFLPGATPYDMGDGTWINGCTAFFIPLSRL